MPTPVNMSVCAMARDTIQTFQRMPRHSCDTVKVDSRAKASLRVELVPAAAAAPAELADSRWMRRMRQCTRLLLLCLPDVDRMSGWSSRDSDVPLVQASELQATIAQCH